jgi:hypothetical protein
MALRLHRNQFLSVYIRLINYINSPVTLFDVLKRFFVLPIKNARIPKEDSERKTLL